MHKVIVVVSVAIICLVLVMAGCKGSDKEVTIGNKKFTEQYIVGQMIKQVLEEHGFKVNLVSELSSMALREGMEVGDIDICAEYTGTAWMVHLAHVYEVEMDNNEVYDLVKGDDKGKGFIWLNPIWNNNTYALASWPEFIEDNDLKTVSDLAFFYRQRKGEVKTFISLEFSIRPDGLAALERYYDFKVVKSSLLIGEPGASTTGLENRQCEVAIVFGTDAIITKYDWHVYIDDKNFFPPYDLTPYIRKKVLDKYPEIAGILNELVATFPGGGKPATPEIVNKCQKTWQELNAKVEIEKMKPDEVAREYLVKHSLIKE